jgi:UDP-glucose 4-epimerase
MERFRAPLPNVDYRTGTITDPVAVRKALEGVEIVFHLANSMVPSTSNQNPLQDIRENLLATVGLLENMRGMEVMRIVFLSSGGTVYGECGSDPVHEDHPLLPISSYGIVKVAIENYLFLFNRLYGLSSCILRASNPFGPRQGAIGVQGIIATMLNRVAKGESIEIWGDGRIVRDYLYVEDLAEGISNAGRMGLEGAFNIGSGHGHSLLNLIDVVKRVTGQEPNIQFQPSRKVDIQKVILDISRIKAQLGWEPKVSIEVGIRRQWEWMQGAVKAGDL